MDYEKIENLFPCYGCREKIVGKEVLNRVMLTAYVSRSILVEEMDFYTHNNGNCVSRAKEKIDKEFGEYGEGILEKIVIYRLHPKLENS